MINDIILNTLAVVGALVLLSLLILFVIFAIKAWQKPSGRFLTVSASGQSKAQPNLAIISLSQQTTAKNQEEIGAARQKNAKVVKAILDAVKKVDGEGKVETTAFRVSPNIDYSAEGKGKILDYALDNSFEIKTKQVEKVSSIIDAALAAGVNNVGNIFYTVDKQGKKKAEEEAQGNALKVARYKAESIAKESGTRLGKVLEIAQEDGQNQSFAPRARTMAVMASAPSAKESIQTPVNAPESIEFDRNVEIKYELI